MDNTKEKLKLMKKLYFSDINDQIEDLKFSIDLFHETKDAYDTPKQHKETFKKQISEIATQYKNNFLSWLQKIPNDIDVNDNDFSEIIKTKELLNGLKGALVRYLTYNTIEDMEHEYTTITALMNRIKEINEGSSYLNKIDSLEKILGIPIIIE